MFSKYFTIWIFSIATVAFSSTFQFPIAIDSSKSVIPLEVKAVSSSRGAMIAALGSEDSTHYKVLLQVYENDNWLSPKVVSEDHTIDTTSKSKPLIHLDSNNNGFIVYSADYFGTPKLVYVDISNNGKTIGSPEDVGQGSSEAIGDFKVHLLDDGSIHFAYIKNSEGIPQLFHNYRSSAGVYSGAQIVSDQLSGGVIDFKSTVKSNGEFHAVWAWSFSQGSTQDSLAYNYGGVLGGSFNEIVSISASQTDFRIQSLNFSAGSLWLSYTAQGGLYLRENNLTWLPPQELLNEAFGTVVGSVIVDELSDNSFKLIWMQQEGEFHKLKEIEVNNLAVGISEEIHNLGALSLSNLQLDFETNTSGSGVLTYYSQFDLGLHAIRYTSGTGWDSPIGLADASNEEVHPKTTLDESGRVVVWYVDTNTISERRFNGSQWTDKIKHYDGSDLVVGAFQGELTALVAYTRFVDNKNTQQFVFYDDWVYTDKSGDKDWNNANNWSWLTVPTSSDIVTLNTAQTTSSLDLNSDVSVKELYINFFSSQLNLNNFDLAVQGTFSHQGAGIAPNSGQIVLQGVGDFYSANSAIDSLVVDGTYEVKDSALFVNKNLVINGTLSSSPEIQLTGATLSLGNSGVLNGPGSLILKEGAKIIGSEGVINNKIQVQAGASESLSSRKYQGQVEILLSGLTATGTMVFDAGTYEFDGGFRMTHLDQVGFLYIADFKTNSPSVKVRDSLNINSNDFNKIWVDLGTSQWEFNDASIDLNNMQFKNRTGSKFNFVNTNPKVISSNTDTLPSFKFSGSDTVSFSSGQMIYEDLFVEGTPINYNSTMITVLDTFEVSKGGSDNFINMPSMFQVNGPTKLSGTNTQPIILNGLNLFLSGPASADSAQISNTSISGNVLAAFNSTDGGSNFNVDFETLTPSISEPTSMNSIQSPLKIIYNLPETPTANSVLFEFKQVGGALDLNSPHQFKIVAAKEISGTDSIEIDLNDIGSSTSVSTLVNGGTLMQGSNYELSISYQDSVGHPAASSITSDLTYDALTQKPNWLYPSDNSFLKSPDSLLFNLPEAPLFGSVEINWIYKSGPVDPISIRRWTLGSILSTQGNNLLNFNPLDISGLAGEISSFDGDGMLVEGATYDVVINYNDLLSNGISSDTVQSVTIDTQTLLPNIEGLTNDTILGVNDSLAIMIPEKAKKGSVKIRMEYSSGPIDVNAPHVVSLDSTYEIQGSKGLKLNYTDLGSSQGVSSVSGGNELLNQTSYNVILEFQDLAENSVKTDTVTNVRFDGITAAPILNLSGGVYGNSGTTFSYQILENALSSSLKLRIEQTSGTNDPNSPHVIDLVAASSFVGTYNFSLNPNDLKTDPSVVSVSSGVNSFLQNGASYRVILQMQDELSSPLNSDTVANILFDLQTENVVFTSISDSDTLGQNTVLSYSLSEELLSGYSKMRITHQGGLPDPKSPYTLYLNENYLRLGSNSLPINLTRLSSSIGVDSVSFNGAITDDFLIDGAIYQWVLEGSDSLFNTASADTVNNVYTDLASQNPIILESLTGKAFGELIPFEFSLLESVTPGSLSLIVSEINGNNDLNSPHRVYLGNNLESVGSSTVNLNTKDLSSSIDVDSVNTQPGDSLVDGSEYQIILMSQDIVGNPISFDTLPSIFIDLETELPFIYNISNNSKLGDTLDFDFEINESASDNSLKIIFTQVGGDADPDAPHELTLNNTWNRLGQQSIPLKLSNLANTANATLTQGSGQLMNNSRYDIALSYQDTLINKAEKAVIANVLVDNLTLPVIISNLLDNSSMGDSLVLDFTLGEKAANSSIKITLDQVGGVLDSNSPHSISLNETWNQLGQQTISLSLSNLSATSNATLVQGSGQLVNGSQYDVVLEYQDSLLNSKALTKISNLLLDKVTEVGQLSNIASNSVVGRMLDFNLEIPEKADSASITLSLVRSDGINDGNSPHVIQLDETWNQLGTQTISLDLLKLDSNSRWSLINGSPQLNNGVNYDLELRYRDELVNSASLISINNLEVDLKTENPIIRNMDSLTIVGKEGFFIEFELLEAATLGSLEFTLDSDSGAIDTQSHVLSPADDLHNMGIHQFEINPLDLNLVDSSYYTLIVKYQDLLGNESSSDTARILVDIEAGTVILVQAIGDTIVNDDTLGVEFFINEKAKDDQVMVKLFAADSVLHPNLPIFTLYYTALPNQSLETILNLSDLSLSSQLDSVVSDQLGVLELPYDVKYTAEYEYLDTLSIPSNRVNAGTFLRASPRQILQFTVDFIQEKTVEVVTELVEYKQQSSLSWIKGGGEQLKVIPGIDMQFRLIADNSIIFDLEVPERGPSPNVQFQSQEVPILNPNNILEYSLNDLGYESLRDTTIFVENNDVVKLRFSATQSTFASNPQVFSDFRDFRTLNPSYRISGAAIQLSWDGSFELLTLNNVRVNWELLDSNGIQLDGNTSSNLNNPIIYPLAPGQYQIAYEIVSQTQQILASSQFPFEITDYLNVELPIFTEEDSKWFMRGLGNQTTRLISSDINFELFRWNESANSDALYSKYQNQSELDSILAGEGFWLYAEGKQFPISQFNLSTEDIVVSLNTDEEAWNQIANPFPYSISVTDYPGYEFYRWDYQKSDYSLVNDLIHPFEGVWVKALSDEFIWVNKPSFKSVSNDLNIEQSGVLNKLSGSVHSSLELKLKLSAGTREDSENVISIGEGNANSTVEHPMKLGSFVELSLLNYGKKHSKVQFPSAEDHYNIPFSYQNQVEGTSKVKLELEGAELLKAQGYQVYLKRNEELIPFNQSTQLPAQQQAEYEIVISKDVEEWQELTRGFVALQSLNSQRLQMNYAFAEETNQPLLLKIFNLKGDLIMERTVAIDNSQGQLGIDTQLLNSGKYFYTVNHRRSMYKGSFFHIK